MSYEMELLGGIVPFQAETQHAFSSAKVLYEEREAGYKPGTIRSIPYYAWFYRPPGTMMGMGIRMRR